MSASPAMTITFWGVRGSLATPGAHTLRYGGNTTCVSVEVGDRALVLDAGTGIRALGDYLAEQDRDIYMLFTHLHADHLSGFPFFAPLWQSGRPIHLVDYMLAGKPWSPLELLNGIFFPVEPDNLHCRALRVSEEPMAYLRAHGFGIERTALNHPGGAFGYRLEQAGRSFVFVPDNELSPPGPPVTSFEDLVAFCQGADVLCHDAQYTQADMPRKRGWGHSLVEEVCELARAADVRHLVLFHHDPDRTDDALDALQERAAEHLAPHGIQVTAAYEGLSLRLQAAAVPTAADQALL